jgi:hypothetical protein
VDFPGVISPEESSRWWILRLHTRYLTPLSTTCECEIPFAPLHRSILQLLFGEAVSIELVVKLAAATAPSSIDFSP